jgi:SPOR domain
MDQKTSNDADKRNWRERLGIGTKDMPRISDEFAKPKEPVLVAEQPKPKAAQGQPIVVAKPAPMAPRVGPKPVERPPAQSQSPTATSGRPMQPAAPQTPDVLAERLRNQRVAAEKLAEQRVSAAKDRAEANRNASASPPQPQAPAQQARPASAPPPKGKPKFTFSEDELKAEPRREPARPVPQMRPSIPPPRPSQQSPLQPQLSPPRPTLGGERPMLPQGAPPGPQAAPPPAGGFPPQFRPASYRPIDPATGYVPPSSAFQPARMPPSGQGPRPPAPDPRARPRLGGEGYAQDPMNEPSLRMPRYEPLQKPVARTEPLRQQNYNFDTDYSDEIFEEPVAPPPRRASATDYNQAYRDQDTMFEPERRKRSGGPWMLLALLLLAAAAAGGGIWFYQTNIKTASNASGTGDAPVVPSPDQPTKTAPPGTAAGEPAQGGNTQALNKKQIYDRIIGDKEVPGGQLAPTEESPVQPAPQQPVEGAAQPSNVPQPDAVPAPAAGSGEESLPLPMPPPPGSNTQGTVAQPAATTQMASNGSQTPNAAAIPQPAAVTNQTMIQDPPAAAPAQADQPAQQATEPQPVEQETIAEEPAPAAKKKPVKTAQAGKPKTKAKALGTKPVVLVPPPEDTTAATQDPTLNAEGEPPLQAGATPEPAPAPVKKKKTLLGLFTGENNKVDDTAPAEAQIAAVQPQTQAQPSTASQATSGFVVQLTSYRSEDEARAEARRVASKHAGILNGMAPSVMKTSAGGSTRYRVAFGTVTSRSQASSVCQQLNAAGERDCIIGRR